MASVMTIMKGFVKAPEPAVEPPKHEEAAKPLKPAEVPSDVPSDASKPVFDPPKPAADNPPKPESEKAYSAVPHVPKSGVVGPPNEHESTEDKIGSSMDIVKNFVVDLVRGAMQNHRVETDRLRLENAEMREEMEIMKKLMSPEQLNELEKEKNNIRKKKNENEKNGEKSYHATTGGPQAPPAHNNNSQMRKMPARQRPEPRNTPHPIGDNLEAKTLALRGLNQATPQGLNHNHVVNQYDIHGHLSKVDKGADWTEQTGHPGNPNSGKLENGINEHIRNTLFRQTITPSLHDQQSKKLFSILRSLFFEILFCTPFWGTSIPFGGYGLFSVIVKPKVLFNCDKCLFSPKVLL